MDERATVFMVDDDPAVRKGVKFLVDSVGLEFMEFSSAQDFLDNCDASQSGCLVLDMRMPMMSGLDLQEELNKRGYVLPIIFLTGHGDVPASVKAFKGGAFDFIEKPPQEQALLDAIQKAIRKDFEGRIVLQSKQEALQILSSLTGKETKILKMIAKGEPNKAVAYEMGLSEKTIEYHRAKIMKNIGVSSIQELMKFAIESGMC